MHTLNWTDCNKNTVVKKCAWFGALIGRAFWSPKPVYNSERRKNPTGGQKCALFIIFSFVFRSYRSKTTVEVYGSNEAWKQNREEERKWAAARENLKPNTVGDKSGISGTFWCGCARRQRLEHVPAARGSATRAAPMARGGGNDNLPGSLLCLASITAGGLHHRSCSWNLANPNRRKQIQR